MISISDAIPVQFWLNGIQSFNDKIEPGVDHICFNQLFNADDEIRIQFTDDTGQSYRLKVYDIDDGLLFESFFDEVDTGVYDLTLIPEDESITNEKIKLVIEIGNGTLSNWASQSFASDRDWTSIAYGNGLFVAVASSGTTTRVATSPDGITWTLRNAAADKAWDSVTFGNGLFVAVAYGGGGGNTENVMTSPDGITWTLRDSGVDDVWKSVTYGGGLFAAVASSGGGGIMTSPDGITWTSRTSPIGLNWESVTYGNSTFVAVSSNGSPIQVMTSPDGITWTSRNSAQSNQWKSVAFGSGLFVAVSNNGTNRVMTSPDGITWTVRVAANANSWNEVIYGGGLFVAVASSGTGTRSMTSVDGITWADLPSAADLAWQSVAYGNGVYAAVSNTGTGNRIMTTSTEFDEVAYSDYLSIKVSHARTKLIQYSNEYDFAGIIYDTTPVPNFMIRIEAKFFKERKPEENESESTSDGTIVKLLGTTKKQKLLQVEMAPYYLHNKLADILQHNSIYIDNQAWVKEENYATEEIDEHSPFVYGNTFLTQKNNSYTTNPFA